MECTAQPAYVAGGAVYPAHNPQLRKALQRIFTIEDPKSERVVHLYEMSPDGKWIRLPRAACPDPTPNTDKRSVGEPIAFECSVVPRTEEQARFIEESSDLLLSGQSFQARAPTGFGKTVVSCKLIADVGRKTLVIVPKTDLMVSWRKAFKEFLGLKDSEIGTIQGDIYDVAGKKVVLGMIHSLAKKKRYPTQMVKTFGLVIWDEVHRLGADQFLPTAGLFHAKLRMGLSATIERWDGMENVAKAHIGEVRVEAEDIPEIPKVLMFPTGWDCCYPGSQQRIVHTAGRLGHILKFMAKSKVRNRVVAHFAKKAYEQDRRTVVFADHLTHLETLQAIAVAEGIPIEDIGFYVGGMKTKELEESAEKKLIFATYGMMGEGTNIPWLDTAVFATPRSNIEQIIGRICRSHQGKDQPVAVDLVDEMSNVLVNYARKRIGVYAKLKADMDIRLIL